jgi:hypothetical protein
MRRTIIALMMTSNYVTKAELNIYRRDRGISNNAG